MNFSRQFPDELLLEIIRHTIPLWRNLCESTAPLSTLVSLSATSKRMQQLVRGVMYQDILLRTPAQARRLLAQLQDPDFAELASRTAMAASLGSRQHTARHADSDFAAEALAALKAVGLRLVEFRYLKLDRTAFWTLKSIRTLYLWFVKLPNDMPLELLALKSLCLAHVSVGHPSPNSYQTIFHPAGLPSLTELNIVADRTEVRASTRADRHAALCALAPQLEDLTLDEEATWLDPADQAFWPRLFRLSRLGLAEPELSGDDVGAVSAAALAQLRAPLQVLRVWTVSPGFALLARNVDRALSDDVACLQALKTLIFPEREALRPREVLADWVYELALAKLRAAADAKGIEVVASQV